MHNLGFQNIPFLYFLLINKAGNQAKTTCGTENSTKIVGHDCQPDLEGVSEMDDSDQETRSIFEDELHKDEPTNGENLQHWVDANIQEAEKLVLDYSNRNNMLAPNIVKKLWLLILSFPLWSNTLGNKTNSLYGTAVGSFVES